MPAAGESWTEPCSRTSLMVQPLHMALLNRSHVGVIHHSDQGSQYCSDDFQKVCELHGIRQSMGSIGDCYDNARVESCFATLKRECVLRTDRLVSSKVLRHRVIEYIETWYYTRKIHTRLGFQSAFTVIMQPIMVVGTSEWLSAFPWMCCARNCVPSEFSQLLKKEALTRWQKNESN